MSEPRRLTMLVHGDSGTGKSWLLDTAPGPRLLLDAEHRYQYTPSNKIVWDPHTAVPDLGPDDTAVVLVRSFNDIELAYNVLASGDHPFKSVLIDSLTEAQQRLMDNVAGIHQPDLQDWGEIARKLSHEIRRFKDLRTHPKNPLWAVVVAAGSIKDETSGEWEVLLNGQMKDRSIYHFDVVGFLTWERDPLTGATSRLLQITPAGRTRAKAKDNTDFLFKEYGHEIEIGDNGPGITDFLKVLNPEPTTSKEEETVNG